MRWLFWEGCVGNCFFVGVGAIGGTAFVRGDAAAGIAGLKK